MDRVYCCVECPGGCGAGRTNRPPSGYVYREDSAICSAGADAPAEPRASGLSECDGVREVGNAVFPATGHRAVPLGGVQTALRLRLLGAGNEKGAGDGWIGFK